MIIRPERKISKITAIMDTLKKKIMHHAKLFINIACSNFRKTVGSLYNGRKLRLSLTQLIPSHTAKKAQI